MSISNDEIIEKVKKLIEEKGPLSINDIGANLMKTHGRDIMDSIKKNYKGLKGLLMKNSKIFKNVGEPPQFLFTLISSDSMPSVNKKKKKRKSPNQMNYNDELENVDTTNKSYNENFIVNGYLSDIDYFLQKQQSNQLSKCFNVFSPAGDRLRSEFKKKMSINIRSKINNPIWESIIYKYFDVIKNMSESMYYEAFSAQTVLFKFYFDLIEEGKSKDTWLPKEVFETIMTNLRVISLWADKKIEESGQPPKKCTDEAARILNSSLSRLISLNLNFPNMAVTLTAVNNIFWIYEHLKSGLLIQKLVDHMKQQKEQLGDLNDYSISQVVTFLYFTGRHYLHVNKYSEASENLSMAFKKCKKKYITNKRIILFYLIISEMMRGNLPSESILEKYNLEIFKGISYSMRTGDLRKLRQSLEIYKHIFVKHKVYLTLEQLNLFVYRRIIKRVFILCGRNIRLRLQKIIDGFRVCGYDTSFDEIECIISNLIFKKLIKGYISHEHKCLVLSDKDDRFPLLNK